MNFQESKKLVLDANILRAREKWDECIQLVQGNLSQIHPCAQLSAWLEIFSAARRKGDLVTARRAAQEIRNLRHDLPSIQGYL